MHLTSLYSIFFNYSALRDAIVSAEKSSAPCASLFNGLRIEITIPPMSVQKIAIPINISNSPAVCDQTPTQPAT